MHTSPKAVCSFAFPFLRLIGPLRHFLLHLHLIFYVNSTKRKRFKQIHLTEGSVHRKRIVEPHSAARKPPLLGVLRLKILEGIEALAGFSYPLIRFLSAEVPPEDEEGAFSNAKMRKRSSVSPQHTFGIRECRTPQKRVACFRLKALAGFSYPLIRFLSADVPPEGSTSLERGARDLAGSYA